jgi:ABC-type polysaccharide/polyol phosphate transport system ATPase subunit
MHGARDALRGRSPGMSLPGDVVVSARGVSKKFCKRLRRSMAYGIAELSKNLLGVRPNTSRLRKHEFWALDGVSFELRRGDVLGLIGVNGSGKTTLLRLIAGIFPPDRGGVAIRGRVGALIALGAGFHVHMTGRENIYLNGAILGMTRREVHAKFDDIVGFAEIGDFVDAPVATYSSGMKVRLGFSIAIHIEPDILLVDEVLAVGDVFFKHKCMQRLRDLTSSGTAIVFVSHITDLVRSTCNRGMLLDQGRILYEGGSEQTVDRYLKLVREKEATAAAARISSALDAAEVASEGPESYRPPGFPPGHAFEYGPRDAAEIVNVEVLDEFERARDSFQIGDEITLRVYVFTKSAADHLGASFLVRDQAGVDLVGTTSHHYGYTVDRTRPGRLLVFSFAFRNVLRPGHYSISVAVNRLADPGRPASGVTLHQFDNIAGYASTELPDLHVYHRVYVPVDVQLLRPGRGAGGQ